MAVSNADVERVAVTSGSLAVLAAANRNRRGLTIYNDTAVDLYVSCDDAATSTHFTAKLAAGKLLNFKGNPIYVGVVTGILASGTGNVQVTEFFG